MTIISTPDREINLDVRIEFFGKAEADFYIGKINPERQRNLNPRKVEKYARQILAGLWGLTHQGIAIDIDGNVIDGQHRLKAIYEANPQEKVPVLIVSGLPRNSITSIDDPYKRTSAQAATISGFEEATNGRMAIARAMLWSCSSYYLPEFSNKEIVKIYSKFEEPILFASRSFKNFGSQPVKGSPIRAAVARAWYHADRVRLEDFLRVMDTGITGSKSEEDSSAICLRNFILNNKEKSMHQLDARHRTYLIALRTLVLFLERRSISRIAKPATTQPFPIPDIDDKPYYSWAS